MKEGPAFFFSILCQIVGVKARLPVSTRFERDHPLNRQDKNHESVKGKTMAHHHDKNRYALAVGHIAIEWNWLERDLQQLALHYLNMDNETAAHMFAFMGNISRADFTAYLAERFEDDDVLKEHITYFIALFHRLRANRNIVEHGVPALTRDGSFLGEIIKIDRRGAMPFAASQAGLDQFLKSLRAARGYAGTIIDCIANDCPTSSLEKPSMPNRLKAPAQRNEENDQ